MSQQPLFDLPPALPPMDAEMRLQKLVDDFFADPERMVNSLIVIRQHDGWYLCGDVRWFGDDGCDWLGRTEADAAARIRELAR